MKRFFALFLCLILCLSVLCGCEKSFSVSCRIGEYPVSLDPQIAVSTAQLTVAQNAFEGLMRYDENGLPVPGAAESYSVSEDGLTYTFTLRKNLSWSNGDPLTAADFLFGLERATSAETAAPCGYILASIVGADDRLAGKDVPLGVSADGRTVKITLHHADDAFLSALCHPVASPCNKKYFLDCGGKYGMDAKTVISNGAYRISFMEKDKTVRLSVNSRYTGDKTPVCSGILLDFKKLKDDQVYAEQVLAGSWDVSLVDATDAATVKAGGASLVSSYDSVYLLLFNPNATVCKKEPLRKSYVLGFEDPAVGDFRAAHSYMPEALTVFGKQIGSSDAIAAYTHTVNAEEARTLFLKNANKSVLGTVNNISVLSSDNKAADAVLRSVVADWQKNLGTYFNIKTETEQQLLHDVNQGNYSIAFVNLHSNDLTALGLLGAIKTALGNPADLAARYADAAAAKSSEEFITAANAFFAVLQNNSYAVPLMFSATSYAYTEDYEGLTVNSNGLLDFSFLRKK